VGYDIVIVAIILVAVPALLVGRVVRPRLEQRRLGKGTESDRQLTPGSPKSDKALGQPGTDAPRALNP
jgi:hypothetical protein